MSGSLFGDLAPASISTPAAWRRIGGQRDDVLFGMWAYSNTDWRIVHSGDASTLFPYSIIHPDGTETKAPSGRGFRSLLAGQQHAEELILGKECSCL